MKKAKTPFLIGFITLLVIALPSFIYFFHFCGQPLSDDGTDWASFGSFVSPFVSISSLIVLGFLSFRIYLIEQNRDWALLEIKKLKPYIVIENIGIGPAKNIIIKSTRVGSAEVDEKYEFKSIIKAGETEELSWGIEKYCNISVTYYNVHDVKYCCFPTPGLDGYIPFSTKEDMIAVFGSPLEKIKLKLKSFFSE
jgi:hypothetical protein